MPPILRSILAIILGWFVGSVVMMGLHLASLLVYPLPEGIDFFSDQEALKAALANMPMEAWLTASLAHGVGTFVGAWLAALLAGRAPAIHAMIIGGVFLAGGVYNLFALEAPPLVWPVDLAVYPIATVLAIWLVSRRK